MKIVKSFVVAVLFLVSFFVFPIKALAVTASGAWSSGDEYVTCGGTINCTFPAEGGSASGTYSGVCNKQSIRLGGRFNGNFTGGWDGTFSGTFSGWHSYVVNGDMKSFNLQGSWRGSIREDGTAIVNFTSSSDLGLDGDVFATFSVNEFENELKSEADDSGVVISGDPGDREPWNTNVLGMNNAYVVVNGERQPFVDGMELQPGMTLETEGEDGLLVFTTSTGEHIRLQGDSKVTLMTTDTVEDSQWKEILDQLTEKRAEGSHSFERNDPNRLKQRTPVTVMHAGQMVVKYEGGGRSGWWNAAFKKDHFDDTDVSSVGFAGGLNADPITGKSIEEEPEPMDLIVENHSLVEYVREGNELTVKVYEGEAVAYKINSQTKENEEVFRVKEGEEVKVDVQKYKRGGESWEKGIFDSKLKSEGVRDLLKETSWWKRLIFKIKGLFKKK